MKYKIQIPKKEARKQKILIYGAGVAGKLVAQKIGEKDNAELEVIGFLDDDTKKHGKKSKGIEILGGLDFLKNLDKEKIHVDEVLIAIPSAPAKIIREIVEACEMAKVRYKILPGIYDIVSGRTKVSPFREVRIEDILGREPVKVSFRAISKLVDNKTMVIFGAGGSIGSELTRQTANFRPKKIILFDQNESGVYDLQMVLSAQGKKIEFIPFIGDIRDYKVVEDLFKKFKPDIVFNAAAYKHVPLMEEFPREAVYTNVLGTWNLLKVSEKYKPQIFVFISTDKAVYPEGVMGSTKRIGELLVIKKAKESTKTKYTVVRFGNVLGSRGSVVPLFLKQIEVGGPITVTHPKIERYFMTIPEASQLVLQAASNAQGGEIFMLEMGERIKILDLAKSIIRLSGFEPDRDIEIKFVGLRPGEKLIEILMTKDEKKKPTAHEKISLIVSPEKEDIEVFVEELLKISQTKVRNKLLEKLKEIN